MDRHPTLDDARSAARAPAGPKATLVVPVANTVPQAFQNARRQQDAARRALERLKGLGTSAANLAELEQRLAGPYPDGAPPTWARTRLFLLDAEELRSLALADAEGEAVYVGQSFRLRPLLRGALRHRAYRVLALSLKRVACYEGGPEGLREAKLATVPHSLEDALGDKIQREGLQWHSTAPGGGAPVYHGNAGARQERDVDLERYQRVLARTLAKDLAGAGPIVLAAEKSFQAALRKEIGETLPLLADGVTGNPDRFAAHELHERAWPCVEALLARERSQALAELERARSRGKACIGFDAVLPETLAGRTARLWLPREAAAPGRIGENSPHPVKPWGDEDLHDELAGVALRRGAEVLLVEPGEDFPSPDAVAAELR